MIMMDKNSIGEKCRAYLEELVGNLENEKLTFWSHKSKLVIENEDLFHRIAKSNELNSLKKMGELYYILNVPNEKSISDQWTVVLDDEYTQKFLSKYGEIYKISK